MTLSLYSTYKAWRRDVAAEKAAAAQAQAGSGSSPTSPVSGDGSFRA